MALLLFALNNLASLFNLDARHEQSIDYNEIPSHVRYHRLRPICPVGENEAHMSIGTRVSRPSLPHRLAPTLVNAVYRSGTGWIYLHWSRDIDVFHAISCACRQRNDMWDAPRYIDANNAPPSKPE